MRYLRKFGEFKLLLESGTTRSLLGEVSNLLFTARDHAWPETITKKISNTKVDTVLLAGALFSWIKKNPSYDPTLLKCAISMIFRESKGSDTSFLHPKEILGAIDNLFGGNRSQGYAQIQPKVAKEHGIDVSALYTREGSIDAAYKMTYDSYFKARKFYSGPTVTVFKDNKLVQIPALNGDAALHMAVASHNAGVGIIDKWCETTIAGIANPCSVDSRKPWEKEKPTVVAKTHKDKPIPNYFPNKGGVHGYMPQIITSFNELNNLPNLLKQLKTP
jgi:hypothetical protein